MKYFRDERGIHLLGTNSEIGPHGELMVCGEAIESVNWKEAKDYTMEEVEPQIVTCKRCREVIILCAKYLRKWNVQ